MKVNGADLIKASSMAIGLVMTITMLTYYVIPPYVFVTPGYSVYVTGIVDSKKIGHGYDDGELHTWHTVSVRLFDDDPINGLQSGETMAYIVTKPDWEMIEWGDIVKIKLLPDLKAEMVELYPSLKLPEWHWLGYLGYLKVELTANKSTYKVGEKACFDVNIAYAPEETWWAGSPPLINLTLFKTFPFWTFTDGEKVFSLSNDFEIQEIVLQHGQEIKFSFEWDLVDGRGNSVPEGIYYVRVYLGYFTEDEENTLTATTMIGIKT